LTAGDLLCDASTWVVDICPDQAGRLKRAKLRDGRRAGTEAVTPYAKKIALAISAGFQRGSPRGNRASGRPSVSTSGSDHVSVKG
jgi:hypothetical protein